MELKNNYLILLKNQTNINSNGLYKIIDNKLYKQQFTKI